jgi:hypothetical protein
MWSLGASAVLAIAEDTGSVRRESAKRTRLMREGISNSSLFAEGNSEESWVVVGHMPFTRPTLYIPPPF